VSKRAEAAWVVFGFAGLAVAATWPLVFHLASALPGDLGDPLLTAWTLAWDADRLRHGLRGLGDAPNFYPYRHTLLYSDHLLGVAVFTAPLQWLTGNPLIPYNAAFIASFVLAGAGMYVLVRDLTGRRDAAAVAGVIFASQPFRVSHSAHLQWLITGWMPLTLWAIHRYFRSAQGWWLTVAAALFLLQATTTAYYTYFGLLPMVFAGLWEWRRTRLPIAAVARHAVPAIALVVMVMIPIVIAYYEVRAGQGLHRSADDIRAMSADVGDYFSAPPQVRLWSGLGSGRGEHELFLGAAAMLLAACGVVACYRSAPVQLYAALAVAAAVLSLGPSPAAWGHALGVPGPYAVLLRVVPGLDGLRAPARLAVVVQVAVAVLAGFGAAWLFDRVPRTARGAAIAAALLVIGVEGWAAPLRLAPFDPRGTGGDRDAYAYLATLPSGPVMELPTSVDRADPEFVYQFMTVLHRHPVVNGHSGYLTPLVTWLGGGHSPFGQIDGQRAAIAALRGIGVRYLVVHRALYPNPELADAVSAAVADDADQIIASRRFGQTTVAALAPLSVEEPAPSRPIPAGALRLTASHSEDRLPLVLDGDRDSRWISGRPQGGDERLTIALDQPRDVASVSLQLGARSFGDYPRTLEVAVVDEQGSRSLFRGTVLPQFARGLLQDGEYPWIVVALPPNRARAIRLLQTGSAHTFFWSIHELRLRERI
jgi:hypothetical protein